VHRLEIGARRLDLLLQRLELALDPFALRLRRALDLRLERLLVSVQALLGALLLRLGVGLARSVAKRCRLSGGHGAEYGVVAQPGSTRRAY